MDFEQWFRARTSRFERFLICGAAVLLVLLFVSQAALTQPAFRKMLSLTDQLEGKPVVEDKEDAPASVRPPAVNDNMYYLDLKIISNDKNVSLNVLVNRETVASFSHSDTVRIPVRDGDLVEVEGAEEENVEIVVEDVSRQIVLPAVGKKVTYFGRPETISWVVVGETR